MSENTEDKTKKLVEKAFRKKTGINERLLCMRLIQATFSTDTKSIIANTCMAASMVEEGYPDKLKDFDFRKFRIMKQIYSDINQTEEGKLKLPRRGEYDHYPRYARIFPIPWSIEFTEDVYNKHISPWMSFLDYEPSGIVMHRKKMTQLRHANELYGYAMCSKGCNNVLDFVNPEGADTKEKEWIGKKCPHCKEKIEEDAIVQETDNYIDKNPEWSFFFEASQRLTLSGFKALRSAFYSWTKDECGKALMIMGRLVSQNIYDEVVKQLRGKPEELEENQKRK